VAHGAWRWLTDVAAVNGDDPAGRRFRRMGKSSCIAFPPGAVYGEAYIEIGEQTIFGPYVTLTAGMAVDQDLGEDAIIRIGDRVRIGRGSHIVAHHSITIDDDVITGPYVYITDQNHVYADVTVPIARQWPANEAVHIGPGCWLGANAVILPGTVLGRNVAVAANTVVRGSIPDFSVVAGAPGKVVRRYHDGQWDPPLRDVVITPPEGFVP
jgi:acetyltransferase-like isoleucine patch superfamily enzyme